MKIDVRGTPSQDLFAIVQELSVCKSIIVVKNQEDFSRKIVVLTRELLLALKS